jgi:hypothetical protein
MLLGASGHIAAVTDEKFRQRVDEEIHRIMLELCDTILIYDKKANSPPPNYSGIPPHRTEASALMRDRTGAGKRSTQRLEYLASPFVELDYENKDLLTIDHFGRALKMMGAMITHQAKRTLRYAS